MNWISIKQKLPKEKTPVITCEYGVDICPAISQYVNGSWYDCWCEGQQVEAPTHWMPLPKLPHL